MDNLRKQADMAKTSADLDRFWSKVDRTGKCWVWTAYRNKAGYGKFALRGRAEFAHRVAWMLTMGEFPDTELDHLCRNRACVNPAHLEPVSRRENVLRGTSFAAVNAAKTHCPQGHPYTAENTMATARERRCRTCYNAYHRRWNRQQKAG